MKRTSRGAVGGLAALLLGCGVAAIAPSGAAVAQDDDWREAGSQHFALVYRPSDEARKDGLLGAAEDAYTDLAAAFGTEITAPITIRLFASTEAYFRDNPMAIEQQGVLVEEHRGRRDIGLIGPLLDAGGASAAAESLRFELAHLWAYELAGGRLPAALQEGVAQYMQRPSEARATWVAKLRDAGQTGELRPWRELAAPGAIYDDPILAQAEALSIVHFLVDRRGWPGLLSAVRGTASAGGWEDAFETEYGAAIDDLETAWRAWLPSYLDGGWRQHALYRGDLSAARALLARGEHESAAAQLSAAVSYLARSDPTAADEAARLLAQARAATSAQAQLRESLQSLSAGKYEQARKLARQARDVLYAAGDEAGAGLADDVAARASIGVDADAALMRARELPPWRITQARSLAYRAREGYGRLGNDLAASRASGLVDELDRREAPAGWALLTVGVGLLFWNLWRRSRDAAGERA